MLPQAGMARQCDQQAIGDCGRVFGLADFIEQNYEFVAAHSGRGISADRATHRVDAAHFAPQSITDLLE